MWFRRLSTFCHAGTAVLATVAFASVQAQEIPVVSIQAMTGPLAFAGTPFQNGIRLAIEEANQKGVLGTAKIKLIELDNAGDKTQAISLASQAIDRERALLVLGPSASSDGVAVAPIFNDKKTPLLAMATADAIIAPGPWSWKFQQSAADTAPMVARHAIDKLNVRKIAVILDRGNQGLVDYKKFFVDAFTAGGGKVVAEETVVSSDTNFLPLVTKLKGMDIDAIYLATYAEQGANILLQLRQAGLPDKVRVLGSLGIATQRYLEIAGKAADGTIASSEFVLGMDRPMNKAFEEAFKAKYKADPESWAATGYSTGLLAVAAIKAAGPNPDREKVRDALSKLKDVPVVVGNGAWNQTDRRPKYGAIIIVAKDGKFVAAQ